MKFSKKLLSLLLCAIMVLGSVAVGGGGFTEGLDAFSVKANAATENRVEQVVKHYLKYTVLIIDEIGYLPIDKNAAY